MRTVRVTGTDFVRDVDSMGLSNTNIAEKNEYYAKLRLVNNQKEEINKVKMEINNLKEDVGEIKSLLRQLIEKGSNG